jgi:outer membrane protein TolC
MRLPGIILLIPFILLLMLSSAGAEALTLREAVNIALNDNPAIRTYNWSIESRKEEVNTAKKRLYPRLSIGERYMRTDNPTYGFMAKLNQERFSREDFIIESLNNPDPVSDFQTSVSIEQPLFVPEINIGIDLAKRELEAGETEFEKRREDVALNVVRTYLSVQTAKEYLTAAFKGLEDAEEHRRLAELRYKTGTGLYSDLLRAEVAVKEAEAMVVKAETGLDIAERALGLILGRTGPVEVTGGKPVFRIDDLEVYLNAASERPDLRALKLRYENALKEISLEKSTLLPDIGMEGGYRFNDHRTPFGTEGESYVFMLFLRWNLFDATYAHRVKKARAKAYEMQEYLSGLEKEIDFGVNRAYSKVKEKEKRLSLSRAALKEAGEALRLVRLRYENGLAPMVDLLETQHMLDSARAKAVEAENEHLTSIAGLYHQSGILLNVLTGHQEDGR